LDCKIALFSMYADNVRIEEHCSKGGLAAVYENGYLLLRTGNHLIPIEEARNIPLTFGGKAEFNIANALAASLAAYTNRVKLNTIREVLRAFVPSYETTPGRVNVFEFGDFNVVIDYAHNPHAVKAVGKFINSFGVQKKVGIITGVGDRRDEDIIALGEESAKIFDEIIIRHDDDMRGRTVEEVENLITRGVVNINPAIPITYSMSECEALDYAIDHAVSNSIVVLLTENIKKVTECVLQHQKRYRGQKQQWQRAV